MALDLGDKTWAGRGHTKTWAGRGHTTVIGSGQIRTMLVFGGGVQALSDTHQKNKVHFHNIPNSMSETLDSNDIGMSLKQSVVFSNTSDMPQVWKVHIDTKRCNPLS